MRSDIGQGEFKFTIEGKLAPEEEGSSQEGEGEKGTRLVFFFFSPFCFDFFLCGSGIRSDWALFFRR